MKLPMFSCRTGIKTICSVLFAFLLLSSISCNEVSTESAKPEEPSEPGDSLTGIISVLVVDSVITETPVPDVEIIVTPGNMVRKTDANGRAWFEVAPGDYFIDADVCCIGPGFIHYHVPVTVGAKETVTVKLFACSTCV